MPVGIALTIVAPDCAGLVCCSFSLQPGTPIKTTPGTFRRCLMQLVESRMAPANSPSEPRTRITQLNRRTAMAWDFSTEPDFEEKLEWMRGFVREQIWPLETIFGELDQTTLDRIYRPLQEQVKVRGLWAAHLDPELGGQGFGQLKLGLLHEILGSSPFAPNAFGCQAPDSGNSEILAIAGTREQKERWLAPLLVGDLKSAFSMTEPDTPGSDPTQLCTRAVRDGDEYVINGHKWFSSNGSIADFVIVMAVTNPDVHPYQGSSMILVPTNTPGLDVVRDIPTMEHPETEFGRFG